MTDDLHCDLLIVGGGINGVAIARDGAGRGLSVVLCEQDDLAAHTSSCSTKLIHGGLRYLEFGQLGMVRKALRERRLLLRLAPHLVHPLRLLLVHDASMRPAWMLEAGLWIYDHLGGRGALPVSRRVDLRRHEVARELREEFTLGFEFSDGWTDDARLVVTTAVDAARRGARVLTRTRVVRAERGPRRWLVQARDARGQALSIRARALVNAAGPWAARLMPELTGAAPTRRLRLIKGSHVVLRRRLEGAQALMLQAPDRRIAFAISYEGDFTLLGTTEIEFEGDPAQARISGDEISYLCALASRYLRSAVTEQDVVWSYSGVRPLIDDGADASSVTRDFSLELDLQAAPLLNVWGGKLTTFRMLGELAIDQLAPVLDCRGRAWTGSEPLPGGDLRVESTAQSGCLADHEAWLARRHAWLDAALLHRWVRAYGSRTAELLGSARAVADLGEPIAGGLYEAELDFLVRTEWATGAEDVLWRRSKLGLHLSQAQAAQVQDWFGRRR